MLRPRPLSRALAAVGVALALLGAATPAGATLADGGGHVATAVRAVGLTHGHVSARAATPSTPLDPTIDRLSSAVIPKHGLIRVGGTVTNDDTVTWHNIRVYPFIGTTPMTSEAELHAASTSDPTIPVGFRVTPDDCPTDACVADVGDLAPGQTATYSLVVSRDELARESGGVDASEPGIYWFGVHTLGETDTQPFDTNADGRARTFLPLLPDRGKHARPEPVSLLLPIRRHVLHRPDGSIADVDKWATDLTTGRLGSVVAFGNTTSAITWLVDPAVLDAVRRLAAGNPPRSLSAHAPAGAGPSPSATATPETAPSPSPSPAVTDPGTQAAQQAAKAWLASFQSAVKDHQVLGLPYGDPDISALAAHDRSLYLDARSQSDTVFKQFGIADTPVVAPLTGYLSRAALRMIGPQVLTVVGDRMIAGRAPAVAQVGPDLLHTTSADAAAGGPLPGDPLSPIPLRQRIISEAALHLADHRPLTVALPYDWAPPAWDATRFLSPFAQSWLSLQPFSTQTPPARPIDPARLRYPESELDAQVQPYVIDAVRALISAGLTLDSVLSNHPGVSSEVLNEALTSVSYTARGGRGDAALRSEQHIAAQLDGITIEPPTAVTLSSDSGRFAVTISNSLPEPVTVQLTPITDSGLDVRVPKDLSVPANGSSSVLLSAAAKTNGVHFVTLQLADSTGAQLGTGKRIPIRTAQVSRIIWAFVGAGLGLLFLAIAVRLVRRVRASRREAA